MILDPKPICCRTCKRHLVSVCYPTWPGQQLQLGAAGQHVHVGPIMAMVLREGDSSGHPAGSWFVTVDCPGCGIHGGGELYIPADPPRVDRGSAWQRWLGRWCRRAK